MGANGLDNTVVVWYTGFEIERRRAMKNDLAYWEKHKEHLKKHFLDWEEFVHAGKILGVLTPAEKFAYCAGAMVILIHLIVWPFVFPPLFPLMLLLALLFFFTTVIRLLEPILVPQWLIQTTRGIYVCIGKDCDLIFECSFSNLKRMRYDVRKKKIHVKLYSDIFPTMLDYGYYGIPKCGKQIRRKNKQLRRKELPPERRMYSLAHLAGLNAPSRGELEMGFYSVTFPVDSGAFEAMMKITEGFRSLERRDVSPPHPLKGYRD